MRDLEEFFDPSLRLPIRGKTYVVESPDAKTGLKVQRLLNTGIAAQLGAEISQDEIDSLELDDAQERDLYIRLLGSAYDEMIADGLPWVIVRHAGLTAFMWVAYGRDEAEAYWEAAGSLGEARRPEPQDHKAPARKTRTSTRTGSSGGSTRQRKRTSTSPSTGSSDATGD